MAGDPAPRPRRPRRVPHAPAAVLAARADVLAKGWLIELLENAPLASLASLPAADFARQAPSLCAAAARAVASDPDFEALRPGGQAHELARRAGAMAGARDAAEAVRAVGALRAVLWAAAREELRSPDPALVEEIAERLAHVAGEIAVAAVEGVQAGVTGAAAEPRASRAQPPPSTAAEPAAGAPPFAGGPDPGAGSATPGAEQGVPLEEVPTDDAARPGEEPPAGLLAALSAVDAARAPTARMALTAAVHAARAAGHPLAVLLTEVDAADRLGHALGEEGARELLVAAVRAVEAALPEGVSGHEDAPGRVWILAAGQGRLGAGALATRAAEAVAEVAAPQGVPLTATVGIAVHPVDGDSPAALAARAEQALWAARASGTRIGGADGPEVEPGPRTIN